MFIKEIPDLVMVIGFALFLILAFYTIIALNMTNKELLRARVFLKKKFIIRNLFYVTIAGSLLAVHEFMEMFMETGVIPLSFGIFSESLEALSLIFLLLWLMIWQGLR